MQQPISFRPWTAHLDLFGNPECDYHARVTIGSTTMNLVLDTGSSNTAVISELCQDEKNCLFVEKPYLPIPLQTEQFDTVNASYGNSKLRSSWRGFATGQVVSFDGIQQAFSRIDVITENQNFLIPRCSKNQGIWGIAYPPLQTRPHSQANSSTATSKNALAEQQKLTLFDAIRREKGLPNSFTVQICSKSAVDPVFSRELDFLKQKVVNRHTEHVLNKLNTISTKQCTREGHLWLGGYPTQSIGNDIVWTPLYHNRYYEVKIDRFLLNGHPINGMDKFNVPRTIVDTGTKDIVLSTENLQQLLYALWHSKLIQFDTNITREHERSFWLEHAQLTLPKSALTIADNVTLAIAFENNKQVDIPIENILNIKPINHTTKDDWINISWTGFSSTGGDSIASTILGNTFLRGKTIIFDRGKEELNSNSRIGFADAAACCRDSSAQDVDILLSVDGVSKVAVGDRNAKIIQTTIILLVILSGVGCLLTVIMFTTNYYREKAKKIRQRKMFEKEFQEIEIIQ